MQINLGLCGYGLMKCECLNNRNGKIRIVEPRSRMEVLQPNKQWQSGKPFPRMEATCRMETRCDRDVSDKNRMPATLAL